MESTEPSSTAEPLLVRLLPARYLFAVLSSIGFAIIYGLKVNLSVAIVAMVNHTALADIQREHHESRVEEHQCAGDNSTSEVLEDGPFIWEESMQGYILASYFWGYLVTQLPGGRMAEVLSAKWVMLMAVLVNAICTLLTPAAAHWHAGALLVARIGEGLGAGVTFPAMHVMISKWAPPDERSMISSIIYAGTALGTVASMLLAGVLAGALGWASVFYVMGGLSLMWCALWIFLVADSPTQQKLITRREKEYILEALHPEGQSKRIRNEEVPPVPWCSVLSSGPFYAILIAHFCSNFGWYMLLIELPTYMRQILRFKIQENAVLSALPFLLMWLFGLLLGRTWESLQKKGVLTTTVTRKISTAVASLGPAGSLLCVCFVGCDKMLVVILMSVAVMCVGGMFSGFLSNHIDISPNFSGTLMAITNTFATIPGFLVPVFVGQITHGNQTIEAWRIIFLLTTALFTLEAIVYIALGSGVEQPWNKSKPKKMDNLPDDEQAVV